MLDQDHLYRENNEYGDEIFELEDLSPSRPTSGGRGLGSEGKDSNGVSKDAALLALEAGSGVDLQVQAQ